MNKYTLRFISPDLERKYQNHRYYSTIPACKAINLVCLLVCVIRSTISLVMLDYLNLIIFAPLGLLVLLVHFVVILYKNQWIDFYLVGINHGLMFYQIYCQQDFLAQEAFVFGQNMMCLHIIIILVSDFQYASIQIIFGAAIKLTLGGYFQPSFSFSNYIYTIILSLMLIFVLYRTNKKYRQSFLYITQNNSLDWLIPIVIENPFVICYYESSNDHIKIKQSNLATWSLFNSDYDNEQNLNHLIRNYLIQGKQLEKFLLSRRRSHQKYHMNRQFEIVNSRNRSDKMLIKYSEVFVTELVFVIIIDKKEQKLQQLEIQTQKLELGVQSFMQNIKTFFNKQLKLTNQANISKLKFNTLYILTKLENNPPLKLKQFNLVHKIKKILHLYQKAHSAIIQAELNLVINVNTYKNILYELMIILMTFIYKQQPTYIKLQLLVSYQQQKEFVDISIQIDQLQLLFFRLQKSIHFKKLLRIISPTDQVIFEYNSIIIRLYRDLSDINKLQSFYI